MTTHDQHNEATSRLGQVEPEAPMTEGQAQRPASSTAPTGPTKEPTESTIPAAEPAAGMADSSPPGNESSTDGPLFTDVTLAELRRRWDNVQTGFVDDPKDCVQKADGLVSDVVEQLISGFTDARSRLEQQWGRGEEASTEDLRVALKRYREFFDRLLAV
jgi:hypothetical protein